MGIIQKGNRKVYFRMKILFFIDKIGGGGRERRFAQLIKELSRRCDVEMMAITAYEHVDYKEVVNSSMTTRVVNAKSHRERVRQYVSIVKEFRPDIIHLWMETPMYCVILPWLARIYKSKYVVGFVADGNPLPKHSLNAMAIRYTFYKADAIVSNSKAGLVAKGAPKKKSHVIYNGFDFTRFECEADREYAKKEFGFNSKYIVSMVARVNKAKDWQSFIDVTESAKGEGLDVDFLAVGGGEMLEYYQQEVKQRNLNNIRFVGRRADVEKILKASDVSMLFTSEVHKEGVSNSIMEAMAAGLPVIATDGGGTPEIIEDGVNGYIIPLHDVMRAFKILKKLISDDLLRKQIGERAKKHIQDHFLLSRMGDDYMNLYAKLLNQ